MVATALGVSGFGTAYWMYGAPQGGRAVREALAPLGRLAASGAVDETFAWGYRTVLTGASDTIGWFDRYVVDGVINAIGYATLAAGARIRAIQTGRVGDYVYVLVAAMLLMGLYGAFGR